MNNINDIVDIFTLDTLDNINRLENEFKNYTRQKKINREYNNGYEYFETNNISEEINIINNFISDIKTSKLISYQQNLSNEHIKLLQLQNDNISKKLEMEKIKLEIIKENNRHEEKMIILKTKNIIYKQESNSPEISKNKIFSGKTKLLKKKTINKIKKNKSENPDVKKTCIDCNTEIFKTSKRCNNCANKFKFLNNKGKRPTYEQLIQDKEELIFNTKIGEKYNVSDSAVRKWFKLYEKYNKIENQNIEI